MPNVRPFILSLRLQWDVHLVVAKTASSSRTAYRASQRPLSSVPLVLLLLSSKSLTRFGCSLINALSSSRSAYRLRLRSSPPCSLRRSSSPKKVTLRLCCSLVNALATRRLATNFFRYQEIRLISFLDTAVAGNLFRYRRLRFPIAGDAHRAFLGTKCVQASVVQATY